MLTNPDNLKLFFEPSEHRYTDNYSSVYTSMTTVMGKYHIPFDPKEESKKYAIKHGVNAKEIAKQWDNIKNHSCEKGSIKHDRLETSFKNTSKFKEAVKNIFTFTSGQMFTIADISFDDKLGVVDVTEFIKTLAGKYQRIVDMVKYYTDRGFRFYAEIGVFSFELLISGMIDLLAVHPDGYFAIIDWKTNRNKILWVSGYYKKDKLTREITDIFVPQTKKMLYPINMLDDCTGTHYQLQLSGYAYLVEQLTGFRCEGIYLFHIRDVYELNRWGMPKKDNKGFYIPVKDADEIVEVHPVKYLGNLMGTLFEHHYNTYNKRTRNNQQILML